MRGAESNLGSAWSRSPGTQVCPATSLLGGFICHRGWNGSELPIDTKDVQCDRAQVSSEVWRWLLDARLRASSPGEELGRRFSILYCILSEL